MQQMLDRKKLSPIDNARLTLNNAALYLTRTRNIAPASLRGPWSDAPTDADVFAVMTICRAILATFRPRVTN